MVGSADRRPAGRGREDAHDEEGEEVEQVEQEGDHRATILWPERTDRSTTCAPAEV
jgi:hypothetical protein